MRKLSTLILALALCLGLSAGCPFVFAQSKADSPSKSEKATAPSGEKIDINSATKDQLQGLPGIGDALSQKIIDARPYRTKRDLVTRKIIPQSTYEKIREQIIAHQAKPKK